MTSLVGHEAQVADARAALAEGRVHHAWLLAGPLGVGKAMFAKALALRFLAEGAGMAAAREGLDVPEDCQTATLVRAESHPDFKRLTRLTTEKGDLRRSISIDQVRGLQGLFATAPTFSPRRAVVIDSIDDLERAAANALLKNLEEPPADTLFLLVSHAPGRLLPTIRSRCRLLRFGALGDAAVATVLRRALPDAHAGEIDTLVRLAEGAPGRAIRFADLDVAGLDAAMTRLAEQGDPDRAASLALSRSLSARAAQPRYEIFLERAPGVIAARARRLHGRALAEAIAAWEAARELTGRAVPQSLDPQATVFELAGLIAALAPPQRAAKA